MTGESDHRSRTNTVYGHLIMKVAILDPGYDHAHSHHHTVDLGLVEWLRDGGYEPCIIASCMLDGALRDTWEADGVRVCPYFETPAYPPNAESLDSGEHVDLSLAFGREIVNALDKGIIPDGAWLVWHTGYAFHLSGIAQALFRVSPGRLAGAYLALMFDPGTKGRIRDGSGGGVFSPGRYLKYRNAFKLLEHVSEEKGTTICIDTSCASYRRAYAGISRALPVGLHPVVTYRRELRCNVRTEANTVLMYLGGPKHDKGFRFALAVTERLLTVEPDLNLIVQYNSHFPGAAQFREEVERLKGVGRGPELYEGNLGPEEYDHLICRSSVMCVLYDPSYYEFKTSGVLWDGARCSEMRWVVSDGTWLVEELEEMGFEHASVPYGDIDATAKKIAASVYRSSDCVHRTPGQIQYMRRIMAPFGQHVLSRIRQSQPSAQDSRRSVRRGEERILVIRTEYGHFGALAGPGGFIDPLREKVAQVDEILIPLGEANLALQSDEGLSSFWSAARGHLKSYQLNSAPVEQRLLEVDWEDYDIVHFLDGEHSGLLTSLVAAESSDWRYPARPKIIATFHQPVGVLEDLVKNPSFLDGFDAIHVLSPCQKEFFHGKTTANIVCVPHGIAPQIVERYAGSSANRTTSPRPIALTTGKWLRDFDALIETAQLLENVCDFEFVVVARGAAFEGELPGNLTCYTNGISDDELHRLYEAATVLFLPLLDGAANNAVLEAMAHGLPIVTRDLPSTRYYTGGKGRFCRSSPDEYAQALVDALEAPEWADPVSLKLLADELRWPTIADAMLADLYRMSVN